MLTSFGFLFFHLAFLPPCHFDAIESQLFDSFSFSAFVVVALLSLLTSQICCTRMPQLLLVAFTTVVVDMKFSQHYAAFLACVLSEIYVQYLLSTRCTCTNTALHCSLLSGFVVVTERDIVFN